MAAQVRRQVVRTQRRAAIGEVFVRREHMTTKLRLVRLLAAAVAALASCLFVSGYSLACSLSYRPSYPVFTDWILRNARYAYALPLMILILGVGFLRGKQERPAAHECLVALLWIGAFVWALVAIYGWQLAQIEIWSGAGRNL